MPRSGQRVRVLVDALGGLHVCPTTPINDPLAGIDCPPAARDERPQRLGYVGLGTPAADLDRMVISGSSFRRCAPRRQPSVWLNPWRCTRTEHAAADALPSTKRSRMRLGSAGLAVRDPRPR